MAKALVFALVADDSCVVFNDKSVKLLPRSPGQVSGLAGSQGVVASVAASQNWKINKRRSKTVAKAAEKGGKNKITAVTGIIIQTNRKSR